MTNILIPTLPVGWISDILPRWNSFCNTNINTNIFEYEFREWLRRLYLCQPPWRDSTTVDASKGYFSFFSSYKFCHHPHLLDQFGFQPHPKNQIFATLKFFESGIKPPSPIGRSMGCFGWFSLMWRWVPHVRHKWRSPCHLASSLPPRSSS
jgi:hypothetical protein